MDLRESFGFGKKFEACLDDEEILCVAAALETDDTGNRFFHVFVETASPVDEDTLMKVLVLRCVLPR